MVGLNQQKKLTRQNEELAELSRYLPLFWRISQAQAATLISKIYAHVADFRPHLFLLEPLIFEFNQIRANRLSVIRSNSCYSQTQEYLNRRDSLCQQLTRWITGIDGLYASSLSECGGKKAVHLDRIELIDFLGAEKSLSWLCHLEQRNPAEMNFFTQKSVTIPPANCSYDECLFDRSALFRLKSKMSTVDSIAWNVATNRMSEGLSDTQKLVLSIYDLSVYLISLINTEQILRDINTFRCVDLPRTLNTHMLFEPKNPILRELDEQTFIFDLVFDNEHLTDHIKILEGHFGKGFAVSSLAGISHGIAEYPRYFDSKADKTRFRLEFIERCCAERLGAIDSGESNRIAELFNVLQFERV